MLIVAAFAQDKRLFAVWASRALVDENECFTGSAPESTTPVSGHAEISRPHFNHLAAVGGEFRVFAVVKDGNVNGVSVNVRINSRAEIGFRDSVDPVIAVLGILQPAVVRR